MKNVGMSLKENITKVEEKAMGGMTLPCSSWSDSKTLMQNCRGLGKRWGDSVSSTSSTILLVPEKIKRWIKCQKKKKNIISYSEREKKMQPPKNEFFMMNFSDFLLFLLWTEPQRHKTGTPCSNLKKKKKVSSCVTNWRHLFCYQEPSGFHPPTKHLGLNGNSKLILAMGTPQK